MPLPSLPSRARRAISRAPCYSPWARSLGIQPWQLPVVAAPSTRSNFAPQFDTLLSQSAADYALWLAQAADIREQLMQENTLHCESVQLDRHVGDHEREEDVREVMSLERLDLQQQQVWAFAQHLAACMSDSKDTPVQLRNPQPTQWHSLSRGGVAGRVSSPMLANVHPSLRALLSPPIARDQFLHVEPDMQPGLIAGVESMCRDVAQWKRRSTAQGQPATATANNTEVEQPPRHQRHLHGPAPSHRIRNSWSVQ